MIITHLPDGIRHQAPEINPSCRNGLKGARQIQVAHLGQVFTLCNW